MQFLALLESLANVITPTNIGDVVTFVEKLITLCEASKATTPPTTPAA